MLRRLSAPWLEAGAAAASPLAAGYAVRAQVTVRCPWGALRTICAQQAQEGRSWQVEHATSILVHLLGTHGLLSVFAPPEAGGAACCAPWPQGHPNTGPTGQRSRHQTLSVCEDSHQRVSPLL